MRYDRPRRFDRDAAEQLMRHGPGGFRARHDPIARLLATAAAPARHKEFAGEQAALAAFRATHLSPGAQPRRPRVIKTTIAKMLTVKAAAVLAVAAAGGVALAATTGELPNPLSTRQAAPATHVSATPRAGQSHPGNDGSPSPSLVGLCHAFMAGAGSDHGKALESPAFQVLVTTAGGKDRVESYCTALLASASADHGADSNGKAEPQSSHQANDHSTSHPTEPPNPHASR